MNASLDNVDALEYDEMRGRARLIVRDFRKLNLLPAVVRRVRSRAGRARELLPAVRMAAIFLLVCTVAAHVSTTGI